MILTSAPLNGFVDFDWKVSAANEEYSLVIEKTYADSLAAENSAEGMIAFFGDTVFDGCYGNQLSGVARELYDSLVKNYATDKLTGEYKYKFKTPFTFNAEISDEGIVVNDELEEVCLEIDFAMQTAMDAFLYDHPEVFWLKKVGSYYYFYVLDNYDGKHTGYVQDITITPVEIYSGASSKISQYDSAVGSALSSITVSENRYDTLKNVHDYICENAWYNLVSEQSVHSSEPFFIGDGGVVCEGYAKAFKVICDELGIPCVLVSGDANGAHMWNYVQMYDGKWYLVDTTLDDQESQIVDTYFLANANSIVFNDAVLSGERTERNDFSGKGVFSFTYPILSNTDYVVHIHEWDGDYTTDVEPTCTENGSKSIHCKSCGASKSVTEIPATDHADKTEYPQQEATCTENGYTVGVYCPDCDVWLLEREIIIKKDHNDKDNDDLCDECNQTIAEILSSGYCGEDGENLRWKFDSEGVLTIFGNGRMKDYFAEQGSFPCHPWYFMFDKCNKIVVEEGVTSITSYAFCSFSGKTVELADSLIDVPATAFIWNETIETINIPKNLGTSSSDILGELSALKSVYASEDCKNYCVVGNTALFSKDKKVMYSVASACTSLAIPKETENISSTAFQYSKNLSDLSVEYENEFFSSKDKALYIPSKYDPYRGYIVSGLGGGERRVEGYSKYAALVYYPAASTNEEYTVTDETFIIENYAFSNSNCHLRVACNRRNGFIHSTRKRSLQIHR